MAHGLGLGYHHAHTLDYLDMDMPPADWEEMEQHRLQRWHRSYSMDNIWGVNRRDIFGLGCIPSFVIEFRALVTKEFQFIVQAVSSTAVVVKWGEPSGDYRNYYTILYRRCGDLVYREISLPPCINCHMVRGLIPGNQYEFAIERKTLGMGEVYRSDSHTERTLS